MNMYYIYFYLDLSFFWKVCVFGHEEAKKGWNPEPRNGSQDGP